MVVMFLLLKAAVVYKVVELDEMELLEEDKE